MAVAQPRFQTLMEVFVGESFNVWDSNTWSYWGLTLLRGVRPDFDTYRNHLQALASMRVAITFSLHERTMKIMLEDIAFLDKVIQDFPQLMCLSLIFFLSRRSLWVGMNLF